MMKDRVRQLQLDFDARLEKKSKSFKKSLAAKDRQVAKLRKALQKERGIRNRVTATARHNIKKTLSATQARVALSNKRIETETERRRRAEEELSATTKELSAAMTKVVNENKENRSKLVSELNQARREATATAKIFQQQVGLG